MTLYELLNLIFQFIGIISIVVSINSININVNNNDSKAAIGSTKSTAKTIVKRNKIK